MTIQRAIDFEFCYKGERGYVHGTDIYNQLMLFLTDSKIECSSADLSFHGVTKNNLTFVLDELPPEKDAKFIFKYTDQSGQKKSIFGLENDHPVKCRYPYNENEIYEKALIDISAQRLVIEEDTSYSFIENIVALNKFLLEQLFPNVIGKWYFTRIQLKEIPQKKFPVTLVFKSHFNFKLTKTEIMVDSKVIGYIYFSLV